MIKKKYVFCHIPKTGGTTIWSLIPNKANYAGHKVCQKSKIKSFLFTFVRDPYSRCLSAFEYLKNGGYPNESDLNDSKKFIGNSDFSDFVLNKLEYASKHQCHFRPQNYWIPEGADFIGRFENFADDIKYIRTILTINTIPIKIKNQTNYDHSYNMDMVVKNTIYDLYKLDFDLFNYKKD